MRTAFGRRKKPYLDVEAEEWGVCRKFLRFRLGQTVDGEMGTQSSTHRVFGVLTFLALTGSLGAPVPWGPGGWVY